MSARSRVSTSCLRLCQNSGLDPDPAIDGTGHCFTSNLRAGAGRAESNAVWTLAP